MSESKKRDRRKELERTSVKDEASDESKFFLSNQFEEKRSYIWMEEQQEPSTRQHNPTGNKPQTSARQTKVSKGKKKYPVLNSKPPSAKPKYKKKSLKKCPFCAELIKVEAIKCRFCGEIVDITRRGSTQAHVPMVANQSASGTQKTWNPGVAAVLSLIIPGAGQLYKGEIAHGIIYFIFVPLGYLLCIPGLILHIFCIVRAASKDGRFPKLI